MRSLTKTISIMLAVIMLFGVLAAAPFTVSAAKSKGLTIYAYSNLFGGTDQTITNWTPFEDKNGDAYVTVEFNLCAPDKHIIGVELDELTWDPNVLEYKESYNMVGEGKNQKLNLFPFALSQDCGPGTYNTFGDENCGRLVGNYSSVSPAALACEGDGSPVTVVRAVFQVLDRDAVSTQVECNFEVLSMCDTGITPYVQYLAANNGDVNPEAADWADFEVSVEPKYPLPFVTGKSLVVDTGEIMVNFYLNVKDPACDPADLKAQFSWGEGNYARTSEDSEAKYDSELGFYYFSCSLPALSMNDQITMELFWSDSKVLTTTYKIVNYATTARNYYSDDAKLIRLLCDMLDYGGTTQLQFNYRTDALASDVIPNLDSTWTRTITAAEDMTDTTDLKNLSDTFGMEYSGCTMSVEARVIIHVSFTVTDAEKFAQTHAFCKNRELEFYDEGSYKTFDITDIAADKIFSENAITFRNGEDSAQKTFSAARYFRNVMQQGYPETLQNVMQAMNNYSNSTADYKRGN